MITNAWDLARAYYTAHPDAVTYRRELLKRIDGLGFKLMRDSHERAWLVDKLDNRKKWRVTWD